MGFTEKVDTLDLIINCLREHEDKLDELVTRIEKQTQAQRLDGFLAKSGNSVVVRVPVPYLKRYGLALGDHVSITIKKIGE